MLMRKVFLLNPGNIFRFSAFFFIAAIGSNHD